MEPEKQCPFCFAGKVQIAIDAEGVSTMGPCEVCGGTGIAPASP